MKRGCFLCLEGIDHSGKTTQAELLQSALISRGVDARVLRFPDRSSATATGALLDGYLRLGSSVEDHVAHLLFSANRWEKASEIRSLLSRGTTLIVDRYSYSGVAYTAAKGAGFTVDWCLAPERGLPKPDLVMFLSLPVELAVERGSSKEKERYERKEFLERVRQIYERDLLRKDDGWVVVDASRGKESVLDDLVRLSLETVSRVGGTEIKTI